MASAVALIRFSSMLQPKRFQLFQPMTGAASGPGCGVAAPGAAGAAVTGDVTVTRMGIDAARASPRPVTAVVRTRFSALGGRIIAAPRRYEIEYVGCCCTPSDSSAQGSA